MVVIQSFAPVLFLHVHSCLSEQDLKHSLTFVLLFQYLGVLQVLQLEKSLIVLPGQVVDVCQVESEVLQLFFVVYELGYIFGVLDVVNGELVVFVLA